MELKSAQDGTVLSLDSLAWPEQGLLPVVVQDWLSGQVLMQAWANRQAVQTAMRMRRGVYFSRSRGEIWVKGETSGHSQLLKAIRLDCDSDSLLYLVEQRGAACHTGSRSCYYRTLWGQEQPVAADTVISQLAAVLESRRAQSADESYTARLYAQGTGAILTKVAEEALEVQQAAQEVAAGQQPAERLVQEVADLWFHTMVLLHHSGSKTSEVTAELQRRFGLSGLEEKALRNKN